MRTVRETLYVFGQRMKPYIYVHALYISTTLFQEVIFNATKAYPSLPLSLSLDPLTL